jgi:hypothetical protein
MAPKTIRVPVSELGKREKQLALHYKQDIIDGMSVAKSQIKALLYDHTSAKRNRTDGKSYTPVASGQFRASWRVNVSSANMSATVSNDAKHSEYVEEGRNPGKVNIAKIQEWVDQKLNPAPGTSRAVAFLIARKIKAKGFGGYGFLNGKVNPDLSPKIQNIIRKNVLGRLRRRMK